MCLYYIGIFCSAALWLVSLSEEGGGSVFFFCLLIILLFAMSSAKKDSEKKKQLLLEQQQRLEQKQLEIINAEQQYQDSLIALKNNPADANLRQKTLELGRVYSNLMRNNQGYTVVDEVSLMNDINAACAATSLITSQQPNLSSDTIESRLQKLKSLNESGLISEAEYNQRKKEVLDSL
jgi:uncharacterized membrane protein YhiD involved in acid resistance